MATLTGPIRGVSTSRREATPFDLREHAQRYWPTTTHLRVFNMPSNTFIKAGSSAQLVLPVPVTIQFTRDHGTPLHDVKSNSVFILSVRVVSE